MNRILKNVHDIPTVAPDYGVYADRKLKLDRASLLVEAAYEAVKYRPERRPSSFLLDSLVGRQGYAYASSMINIATLMELEEVNDAPIKPDLWLGVKRENASRFSGSILVQRDVTLTTGGSELLTGTCIEGFVTDSTNHGLVDMYQSAREIAYAIAGNQPVFAIESAPRVQTRFDKLRDGKLTFDDELLQKMGQVFAHQYTLDSVHRTDMPKAPNIPRIIYSNAKI